MVFEEKKVLVCGGTGFIGSHVVDKLLDSGSIVSVVTRKKDSNKVKYNLDSSRKKINLIEANLNNLNNCKEIVKEQDIIFNCASSVGSMAYSKSHADIFRNNVLIELNLLEASRLNDIEKYLMISSASIYPEANTPLKEKDSLLGEISDSKFGYGWSKRANEIAAKSYFKQYGMKIAIVRPANVYGPRDNFSSRGLVIPTFIENVFSNKPIVIAGDGSQIRDFINVADCVEGIFLTLKNYCIADPLNLSTAKQTTIKELAEKIIAFSEKKVTINYNKSSNIGPKKIVLDGLKAEEMIGFKAKISLDAGLKETIDWFKKIYGKN